MSRDIQYRYFSEVPPHLYKVFWQTRVGGSNNRAKRKGYPGLLTIQGILAMLENSGEKCACCGSQEYLVLDHKIPLAAGGLNIDDNIQFLCDDCNALKRDSSDEELARLRLVTPRRNWRSR